MAINIASGFELGSPIPLDDRDVFDDITARDALPDGRRYEGLMTWVKDIGDGTGKLYQLQGGITNADWAEAGGGGSDIGNTGDYALSGYSARFSEMFTSTDLLDTLNKIIKFQYTAPAIALGASPSTAIREKGANVASVTLTATTTKRSDPITTVEFYRAGALVHTVASPTANGGSEVYVDNTPFTDTMSFYSRVYDGTTWVNSNTVTYSYTYPYYYGVGAQGLTGAQIAGLTKDVRASTNNLAFTSSPASQVFYFAQPASYPNITSVLDPNGFETIGSYTSRLVNITGLDGTTQSYRVWEFNTPTTQTNFTNTFRR